MHRIVDLGNSEKYGWGDGCWGWRLNKEESLSVIQEEVPPGKSEKLHFHRLAAQFFYILEGEAEMMIDGESHRLGPWQGIKIDPLEKHKFINSGQNPVKFLVITVPKLDNDRFDLE